MVRSILFYCIRGVNALRRFVFGAAIILLAATKQSAFDRRFYRQANWDDRWARWFPLLQFAFIGAWKWKDPSAGFSSSSYAAEFPANISYLPPYLDAQLRNPSWRGPVFSHGASATGEPSSREASSGAGDHAAHRKHFEVIWENSLGDLEQFMDIAHQLTPNTHLHYKMYQNIRAPYVNRANTLSRILENIPKGTKHVLALPLLGTAGGSEKISADLIRVLTGVYNKGEVAVVGPDSIFHMDPENRSQFDIPVVSFNDVDPSLTTEDRIDLFDRVMIETRPPVLHSVNSDIAWLSMVERGIEYANHSRLFGSAYSDIRVDTLPVGAFWRYVPQTIDALTGIIVDNGSVARRAKEHFGFTDNQLNKFVIVPTALEMAYSEASQLTTTGRSLWLSRIAQEKRIDVLGAISRRLPGRKFDIYGAVIKGAFPVDLSWMESTPNVEMRGKFKSLQELPVSLYDSYIFTTSAEGLPVVLLEMTALGLPIVAPDVGGIGEFIDSSTGWLVSGPDAVDEYISAIAEIELRPDLAARKVSAAQQRLADRHSFRNFSNTVNSIPGYIWRGV